MLCLYVFVSKKSGKNVRCIVFVNADTDEKIFLTFDYTTICKVCDLKPSELDSLECDLYEINPGGGIITK